MGTAREVTRVVGDTPMRWLEHDEGAPVVLVHGIPSGARLWRHVLPRLAGVRGLAWEMVGYGESIPAGRGRDLSLAAQADSLIRWLDALGIEQAILGGHDLGGGVVQIAAVRHPGRCAGLLLTNSIGYDNWPVPEVRALRAVGGLVRRLPARAVKLAVFRPLMALGHDHPGAAQESLGRGRGGSPSSAPLRREVRAGSPSAPHPDRAGEALHARGPPGGGRGGTAGARRERVAPPTGPPG